MAGLGTPDVPEVVDCLIEECICEQPSINNIFVTTVINISAGERSTDGVTTYHRASVIRNCVVDCEYKVNPVPISQITFAGTSATVTTRLPHGRVANDWVRISGALVNGLADNPFNGSFQIANPSSTTFQYTMPATPAAAPVGDMWVGRFSSHLVAISSVSVTSAGPPEWTVKIVTATPHFRVPGNNVAVDRVTVGGSVINPFNGSFLVTAVGDPGNPDPKILYYKTKTDPGTPDSSQTGAFVGVQFQALSNDAGTAAVAEGNRIFNCRVGGPSHDTYNERDLIVRNNHYRGVVVGPTQGLGVIYGYGLSTTRDVIPLVSLTNSGNTAIATTSAPHGFTANVDKVIISGATGADATYYNTPVGNPPVITAVTSTTFQYQMTGVPTGPAPGTPPAYYATSDRQRILASLTYALESGVYVASAVTSYAQHGFSIGDAVFISKATGQLDQAHNDFFNGYHTITAIPNATTFKYALVDNPNPPNQSGSSLSGYFGRLWQAGRVVIEDNVIELIPTPTNYGPPIAIELDYGSFVSPPLFRQVVIRQNVIRHVDNASDPPNLPQGLGIQISGCGNLILEENVVDLDSTTPIKYYFCDRVRFFNNHTSAGVLIQGVDVTNAQTPRKASELTTEVEDAVLLAI